MTELGMGAMIGMLGGNEETVKTLKAALGKKITAIELKAGDPEALLLTFEDESRISVEDDAQSCCERRYMTTDDDLQQFVGATLESMEIAEGPSTSKDEWMEEHDTQFLRVYTSEGVLTMVTHVEHNGYYGGFWLKISSVTGQ